MPHFQPKDRVSVPGIGNDVRVRATVVLTLPRGNSSVLVHVGRPSRRLHRMPRRRGREAAGR